MAADQASPYDDAAGQIMGEQASLIRNNVQLAVGVNPDQAAHYQHLAKYVGVPVETVHAEPDAIKRQAAVQDFDAGQVVNRYPHLARYLSDPSNANKSHDDIPRLAGVEQAAKGLPAPNSAAAPPDFGDALRENVKALFGAGDNEGAVVTVGNGLWGSLNKMATPFNLAAATVPLAYDKAASLITGQDRDSASSWWFKHIVDPGVRSSAAGDTAPNAPFVTKAASTAGNLVGALAAAYTTGGESVAAEASATIPQMLGLAAVHGTRSMAIPSLGEAVDTGRKVYETTGDAGAAVRAAQAQYAATTFGGIVPLSAPGGLATRLVGGFASGATTGELTRQGMNLVLPASMQQPFDIESTILSGLTASVLGGVMGPRAEPRFHDAVRQTYVDAARAEQAEQGMQALQALGQFAQSSKLRSRDTDAFREFVRSVTDEGNLQDVYVEGRALEGVLNQAGITPDQLAQTLPDVAAQLHEARQTNGDVRIPVSDYATLIAGGPVDGPLLPHLKTDPSGMTYQQSQDFYRTQSAQLHEQAATIAGEKAVDDQHASEARAIHDNLLGQLDAAGRYRPDVNKALAAYTRDFYVTQAERNGMTPGEMFERHPLRITAERGTGDTLSQADRVKPALLELADANFEKPGPQTKVPYREVAPEIVKAAAGAGLDVAGYTHTVDSSAVRHILKNHGDEAKEVARGNLPVTRADIASIPSIIDSPDKVIFGQSNKMGRDLVTYLKRMPDGTTLYLEEVRTGRKELAATSLRKYPATTPDTSIIEALRHTRSKPASRGDLSVVELPPADNTLAQGERGGFTPDTNTITLLKDADLSTFLHESGHFFLEVTHDLAGRDDAPAGTKADFDTLLKWFGETGTTPEERAASWTGKTLDERRVAHEQFARGFEAYLLEGKAPTTELQGVFSRFRSWLLTVYRSLADLKVELTPEVRGVMDRMLASDDAIRQAEQTRGYLALDLASSGAPGPEIAAYRALGAEATDQALTEMTARSLRDMKWLANAKSQAMRSLQREAAAQRNAIRDEVTKEVEAQPINQARRWLTKGETTTSNGSEVKAAKGFRLNSDALKSMYPENGLGSPDLAKLRGMTAKDGLHPDLVAEMFGFKSGDELVRQLADNNPKDEIQGLTDQRMLERHGELTDPVSIERAAEAAIHNEARAKFMATGLKILTKSPTPAAELARAAKEAADAAVAVKQVGDLRPSQYAAAEARSNKEAIKLAPTDPVGAVLAQRAALLNNRLFTSTSSAVEDVRRGLQYLKRINRESLRAKVDLDIRQQIDDLLARFDLRQNPTTEPTRQQLNLQQWVDSQQAVGYSPSIAPDMLNPAVRMHYKEMSVEQFRGLVDSIRAMEHVGRERKTLTIEGQKIALDDYVRTRLVPKLQERGERFSRDELLERPEDRHTNPVAIAFDHFGSWLRAAAAQLKPQEFKRNQYDRHETLGPFGESITDPIINANYRKVDMLKGLSDDFQAKAAALGREWQDSLRDSVPNARLIDPDRTQPTAAGSAAPEFMHFTRGKLIGVAIHVGNESNFDKLTKGWGWKPEDTWAFLHDNMTAKDWQAVQAVWDLYEKHWPETAAMYKRLGQTIPDKIEARAFPTKYGEMRGGYAAISYDALRSRRGEREASGQAINPSEGLFNRDYFSRNTPTNGSMHGRIEGYTDRVDLDFHGIARKLQESVHDLAYREVLIDAHKIIEHRDFKREFRSAYGREAYSSLQDWVGQLANSNNVDRSVGAMGKFLQYTRTGMVINAIGFRASTVLKHGGSAGIKTMGYFVGGGEKYLASRMASMGTDYMNQIASAKDKFGEIRARLLQQDRDFRVTSTSMFEPESAIKKAERFGHAAVAWSDMMTAVPTAWAAYDRAVTEGIPKTQGGTGAPMTEAQAVAYANKVVREAHGSNVEAARSMVMNNSSEAMKMFTTLYGFMNTSYGQQLDGFDKLRTAGISNAPVLARTFMAIIVPALWAGYLTHGAKKDDEGWGAWIGKAIGAEVGASVPFVRDAYSMFEGYSHAGQVGVESWLASIVLAVKDIAHSVTEDRSKGKPIKDILNAVGMGLHIPGLGQLGTTAQYVADVQAGKEHPDGPVQYTKDALLGPKHPAH